MTQTTSLDPTTGQERIQALDILRGVALLGILIMNIQSFAMPGAAYLNPMSFGDMTGINKWVWIISHVFADQKFMTIFSILFGAGIILVTDKAMAKTGKSAGLHYRRNFWLLVVGLVHAHLIWYGDILFAYAVCGFIVYLFRNASPRKLIIIGTIVITVHTVIYSFFGMSMSYWPPESVAETMNSWAPPAATIQEELDAYLGTYGQQLSQRSMEAFFMETFVFLMAFLWRAGGLMLVGMGLYKMGVLSAQKETGFYKKGWLVSWLIGLPLTIFGVVSNFKAGWEMEYSMFLGSQWNYWGSLFISYGFICMIMLFVKSDFGGWIKNRLAAVGQMALTNYLMQSIICTFIFYGIGFGLFGSVERWAQMLIVLGVWIIQIAWSRPWINNFRFGPFEWLWRSLTYMKLQPFKR